MASNVKTLFNLARFSANRNLMQPKTSLQLVSKRAITCTETGAILPKPDQTKFGVLKALLVVIPFLYLGGSFASNSAALLEDYELFVPQDEDDD